MTGLWKAAAVGGLTLALSLTGGAQAQAARPSRAHAPGVHTPQVQRFAIHHTRNPTYQGINQASYLHTSFTSRNQSLYSPRYGDFRGQGYSPFYSTRNLGAFRHSYGFQSLYSPRFGGFYGQEGFSFSPQYNNFFHSGFRSRGNNGTIVAEERFVNRLLNEETQAIIRNTRLLNLRDQYTQRLSQLESQVAFNPRQERFLQFQIRQTQRLLDNVQHRLDLNHIHLVTTIPGIESGIQAGLNQLQAQFPNNRQVADFVDRAATLAENNAAALAGIIGITPASK
ncbi:MAG: hypothetical protein NVSMB9_31830 [Isosphaeraceae bacterium]